MVGARGKQLTLPEEPVIRESNVREDQTDVFHLQDNVLAL